MPRDRRITDGAGLLQEIRRRGYTATPTANGHYQVVGPAGIATVSLKWGDHRDRDNTLLDIRRHAGIDVTTSAPFPRREPAVSVPNPPKLTLPGPRPTLSYDKTQETAMNPRNGHPAPPSTPTDRADYDTLLSMIVEQGERIEHLTSDLDTTREALGELTKRLEVAENSVDAVAVELAGLPAAPKVPVDTGWVTAMRSQVNDVLTRFRDLDIYMPRATIAEAAGIPTAGDHPDSKRLSYVLQMMREEGLIESVGAKSATRWRLVRGQS